MAPSFLGKLGNFGEHFDFKLENTLGACATKGGGRSGATTGVTRGQCAGWGLCAAGEYRCRDAVDGGYCRRVVVPPGVVP